MTERVLEAIERFGAWLRCRLGLCWECERCETYVCPWCGRRVPWENGAGDDMPEACDQCWAIAHATHRAI